MALGPIEVLVVGFPGNDFNGEILPELERLVESDTIAVVDALLVVKDTDGEVTFIEIGEDDANDDAKRLAALLGEVHEFISDDDVDELVDALEPGSSAAILVFEHTWAKPFRDAVVDSGGVLVANFRVPGLVVEELLADLEANPD